MSEQNLGGKYFVGGPEEPSTDIFSRVLFIILTIAVGLFIRAIVLGWSKKEIPIIQPPESV